jgi:WD40 repeat protein
VPKPGFHDKYYIFTVDAEGGATGFRYSEVELTLNNGLGDVVAVSKNTLLFAPSVEKVAAVKHSNGLYTWVIAHGLNNNRFYAYLIDCNGINAPVTSDVGLSEGTPGWGGMAISSDGNKIAKAARNNGFELFDFNSTTGLLSNPVQLNGSIGAYGISFSPNNNLIYGCVIEGGAIYQWNLNAGTTAYSSSNEITGTGYVAGGKLIQNVVVNSENYTAYVSFDNPYWNPASFTTRCALIYNVTKANRSIAVLDFGSDKTCTATFLITMPANTATTALIRSSN